MLLWLWGRLAAAAPILPLAWELPYAIGRKKERKKEGKKERKKEKERQKRKKENLFLTFTCYTISLNFSFLTSEILGILK